jgi:hypothetical protein
MLVAVHSFGSIWTFRQSDRGKGRTEFAYFNTTGVWVRDRFRHRSSLYGYVRVDAYTGFRPDHAFRYRNRVFISEGLQELAGKRKLFLKSLIPSGTRPDMYLVVIGSEHIGFIARSGTWASSDVQVVSFSEGNSNQEVMLMMPAFAWVRGSSGTFCTDPIPREPWKCRLANISEGADHAIHERGGYSKPRS